jgi:cytochrome P450
MEDAEGRETDLLKTFAEPLPVTVIADLLGIPETGRARLLPWSKAIIGMFEPERTPEAETAAVGAAAEFADYLRSLLPHKRAGRADDLLSRMVAVHDAEPERLSEDELIANAILFLDAGHEAVVNVIGNGFLALLRHPDQLRRVQRDASLVPTAVEEMMRYDTPLQFFERVALEDVELGPHVLRRGERACLVYASANRDAAVFDAPERFDVGRHPNPHIAFGLGLHYCIGAPLARLELTNAVTTLLERFPRLELVTREPHFLPKNVFRYLAELRVRY